MASPTTARHSVVMGVGLVSFFALITFVAGIFLYSRSRRSKYRNYHGMSVEMMISMTVPFAIAVLTESVFKNEILAILVAVIGTLTLAMIEKRVLRIEEIGERTISSVMSAMMASMMVGMSDVIVVNFILIALSVVSILVGKLIA